jgi:hypothetical protein
VPTIFKIIFIIIIIIFNDYIIYSMIEQGDCVQIPDGRIGRVRDKHNNLWRVRVRRQTSNTYAFMFFTTNELKLVDCPNGWMSKNGYNSYLSKTLAKMKKRLT